MGLDSGEIKQLGYKANESGQIFVDYGAIQCGFCTPGMVMSATALLEENPKPTEDEVRMGIAGNICRCTGYTKIVEAILALSEGGK